MDKNYKNALIEKLTTRFDYLPLEPQFWLLVDPDKKSEGELADMALMAEKAGVDAFLVGSSILIRENIDFAVKVLKDNSTLPVIIFPGNSEQVSHYADALLFLTLLSSRNVRWLVEEQVFAAPKVKKAGIPVIPTGYILVDSGNLTSVGFFSSTPPIPSDKPDIAVAHALAAQYMGMHAVFLEAGSGAKNAVPIDILKEVRDSISIPIIVGGGVKEPSQAYERAKFADVVVVGTAFEEKGGEELLGAFARAIHNARK